MYLKINEFHHLDLSQIKTPVKHFTFVVKKCKKKTQHSISLRYSGHI